MQVKLQGVFIKQLEPYTDKDGKKVPQANILSGEEVIKVSNIDCSGLDKYQDIEILCNISLTKYGLFVRAVQGD